MSRQETSQFPQYVFHPWRFLCEGRNRLTMTELTDSELFTRWRGGDTNSFTHLVKRYQGQLLRHARGMLGQGREYEDVVQEVFLKLARDAGTLRLQLADNDKGTADGRQLAAWLHTVTRNACMDIIRSEKRRKHREEAVAPSEATTGAQHEVDAQDTKAFVERAIASLPLEQREVLVLRLFAERSYREIAEMTGRKVGTVGWLISEGLKALSTRLAPQLGIDGESNGKDAEMGVA
ncbi:MAG: RNA polymerase sigma factor (sigma-70 family) [Planctomycetota bacterium]|jgi:RNA polymerase sigma factor (sigma-70 family)